LPRKVSSPKKWVACIFFGQKKDGRIFFSATEENFSSSNDTRVNLTVKL